MGDAYMPTSLQHTHRGNLGRDTQREVADGNRPDLNLLEPPVFPLSARGGRETRVSSRKKERWVAPAAQPKTSRALPSASPRF